MVFNVIHLTASSQDRSADRGPVAQLSQLRALQRASSDALRCLSVHSPGGNISCGGCWGGGGGGVPRRWVQSVWRGSHTPKRELPVSQVRLEVVTLRFPRVGTRGLPAHHTLLFLPRSPTGNETGTQRKVCHLLIESRVLGILTCSAHFFRSISCLSVYQLSIIYVVIACFFFLSRHRRIHTILYFA